MTTTQDQRKALQDLLSSAFNSTEGLRQWLSTLDNGQTANNLPGGTVAPAHFNFSAADIVVRYGWVTTHEFWDSLEKAVVPPMKPQVRTVRSQFGVAPPKDPIDTSKESTGQQSLQTTPPPPPAKIVVLLASASPDTAVRIRVDKEFSAIITRMRSTNLRDRFEFVQIQAATFDTLRSNLQQHKPHVLHISSHGTEDGALKFEPFDGDPGIVSKSKLLKLFRALRADNLRLIVVNACHSHALTRDIPSVIDLAIGMSDNVKDKAAIDFAVAFYEALGYGRDIENAFDLGTSGLDDVDDQVPQLFPILPEDTSNKRKLVLINP